jgi:adenylate cyclase class 2
LNEVEAKFRVDCGSLEGLRAKLETLGFKYKGLFEEVDSYYSHPCRDFMSSDEALRVRISGNLVTLTYKGPRVSSRFKERLEVNVRVEGDIIGLLEHLGFKHALSVRKLREYFEGEGATVAIDRVEGLGCFIEVEAREADVGVIDRVATSLGVQGSRVDETYVELLLKSGSSPPSF